jgi:hypothetical protein
MMNGRREKSADGKETGIGAVRSNPQSDGFAAFGAFTFVAGLLAVDIHASVQVATEKLHSNEPATHSRWAVAADIVRKILSQIESLARHGDHPDIFKYRWPTCRCCTGQNCSGGGGSHPRPKISFPRTLTRHLVSARVEQIGEDRYFSDRIVMFSANLELGLLLLALARGES